MSKSTNNTFDLGKSNTIYNQVITVATIIIFSISLIIAACYELKNEDLIGFIVVISLFSIYILVQSLKLNRVRVSQEYFYIDSILRHKKIEAQKFEKIKIVSILPVTIKIYFKDGQRFLYSLKKPKSLNVMLLQNREIVEKNIIEEIHNIIN